MKATITSTGTVVPITKDGRVMARVWEGVTEGGVPFTAYVQTCQVAKAEDQSEFERELSEHKPAEPETMKAIDARFII